MRIEMRRQCSDALATMTDCAATARDIAVALRKAGRGVLYGVGGSHYVNRMVEPLYREAGLDVRALSASEALMAPLPPDRRVALIASQSGESGEIVELLRLPAGQERRFGLTLNGDSTLGRSAEATLVASGGPEHAFAATRSIILTVAMHAAVLQALGQPQEILLDVLAAPPAPSIEALAAGISGSDVVVFSGCHVMQGVAQSAALSLMELSRVSAIGLERNQFRHGPMEFLRPGVGVVLLRSAGPDCDGVAAVAAVALDAGCMTAVLDAADAPLPKECLRIQLPRNEGLAAAASALLTLQHLNIAVALRRIPHGIGTPLRTTKVTV